MAKRGKILRDPLSGPGLLIAEGRQYQFLVEGTWKSQIPPQSGSVVEIEFDTHGKIVGITAVPDSQLAREEAELRAGAKGQMSLKQASAAVAQSELTRFIATALLLLSWVRLTAISVDVPLTGILQFTFWQLLRCLSATYPLLALLVVGAPFVYCFWKRRSAALGGVLPLVFMLLTGILLLDNIGKLVASRPDRIYQEFPKQTAQELLTASSLGFGIYVSLILSIYLAYVSVQQFRSSNACGNKEIGQLQKAAV